VSDIGDAQLLHEVLQHRVVDTFRRDVPRRREARQGD
jgi:hypothetical protein